MRQVAEEGTPVAVASASAAAFIDAVLEVTGLGRRRRDPGVGPGMPQDQGKPDPEVYLRCLARLDADLSEAVAVEDSTAGVIAALRAGLESWLLDSAVARSTSPMPRRWIGCDTSWCGWAGPLPRGRRPPHLPPPDPGRPGAGGAR
ncbi:MAG: HAD family hydrolase [Nocardioides sp.]